MRNIRPEDKQVSRIDHLFDQDVLAIELHKEASFSEFLAERQGNDAVLGLQAVVVLANVAASGGVMMQ